MTQYSERIKEIEARKEELRVELEGEITQERVAEITEEARALSTEEKEVRAKIELTTELKPGNVPEEERTMPEVNEKEVRAQEFKNTGSTEFRALLSTGKIAKPSKVDGINGLADDVSSIVDDVNAVALTGNGAFTVAYKKTEAGAEDVTDGNAIGGTAATFDYVAINPAEWGVHDEISNQVAKMSPLDYEGEIKNSALIALRAMAEKKIVDAVLASDIKEDVTAAIDADYLRTLVLGFHAIPGKGAVKLYLNRADLIALGKVRGTAEKKALYEITFDNGSTTAGVIKEGGLAVAFSVTDKLSAGTQLFGQPMTISMPMWDNYKIETNDGGEYFKKNMIGIRGIQTANADLAAFHGMQKVANA